jgi:pimeloyl-ACP methyl ester carboxylesterase
VTPDEVRATARLGAMALTGTTALVRGMHRAISARTYARLGPLGLPVRAVLEPVTDAVYALVGAGLWAAATGTGEVLARQQGTQVEVPPSVRTRAALAAVNGAFGDLIEREVTLLAPVMAVRVDGRDVAPEPGPLAAAFPAATGRIVVFVHGLVESDDSWTYRSGVHHGRPGVSYASLLEEELGYTCVLLRYNSGLRISENGRRLDALLAALVASWPVPVTELVLVGHSMGGLVARSALARAAEHGSTWPPLVSTCVTLGTPHLGAPLEKAAAAATLVLAIWPTTRPLGQALATRSVGIKDLRYGNLLDADWADRHPESLRNHRLPVPLHDGVQHYAVLGVAWQASRLVGEAVGELVGDLMVRPASATGASRGPHGLGLARDQVHRLYGLAHLDLLNHPEVYARLRAWLADGAGRVAHQNWVPGSPLNGPTTRDVIQPP